MRTTALIGLTSLFLLSGCQHLSVNNIKNKLFNNSSTFQDYPATCLAKSRLPQPSMVGQVIDTPRYAMITLERADRKIMGGELCIINKITQHVEITAIQDLQFLTPSQPQPSEPAVTGNNL
ncbi:MAG: hypothetical protein VXW65_15315 [Pseudomonadota bacterium]|nr:hypothetical protein [Pseudomonadota bacterium]